MYEIETQDRAGEWTGSGVFVRGWDALAAPTVWVALLAVMRETRAAAMRLEPVEVRF